MIKYIRSLFTDERNIEEVLKLTSRICAMIHQLRRNEIENEDIVFQALAGNELLRVSASVFLAEANNLFTVYKKDNSYAGFQIDNFVNALFHSHKNQSTIGNLVKVILQDRRIVMDNETGGSASTLLNAGEATNILYKVVGKSLSDEEINEINGIDDHQPRIKAIFDAGCTLKYAGIEHETFKNNLLFLDSNMPQFIADCLVWDCLFEGEGVPYVRDAVEKVVEENPLHYTGKNVLAFYEHKMKVLLLDAALGMTPAKEWTGRYDANGGYIVVRKDGEIVCYHFYNRNDVEDYLYNNTRFERASRSRYNYGSLFRNEKGEACIKLNLQIRFKK